MIRRCECVHKGQDELHGRFMRVMNLCKDGSHVRCTICRKEYGLAASKIVETKEQTKED